MDTIGKDAHNAPKIIAGAGKTSATAPKINPKDITDALFSTPFFPFASYSAAVVQLKKPRFDTSAETATLDVAFMKIPAYTPSDIRENSDDTSDEPSVRLAL